MKLKQISMKNYILSILLSVIALLFAGQVQSQEVKVQDSKLVYKHALGAAAGYTTGCGLSYKYSINKFSAQLVFLPIYIGKDDMSFSTGLTFMYRLVETNHVNLFLYEGNHWHYYKQIDYGYYNYYGHYYEDIIDVDNYLNCGVGFGLEFKLGERLAFNLMFGYSARENFEKLKPTIETGLFYNF
jgi:hypothetical protein